jgi:hypothetical protein
MRFDLSRPLAALAIGALCIAAPAAAEMRSQEEIAREIERKARAGEQDAGFCARVGADLVKLTRQLAAEQLNRLLARPDQQPASIVFVMSDLPNGGSACAYLAFRPVTTRSGKRCRPADSFLCIVGQDCRAQLDGAICQVRPGVWD